METPEFTARLLTCVECHEEFLFTVGEQEFFASKDLQEPKRCCKCRAFRRRANRVEAEVSHD